LGSGAVGVKPDQFTVTTCSFPMSVSGAIDA
jgi:hypothetical protein